MSMSPFTARRIYEGWLWFWLVATVVLIGNSVLFPTLSFYGLDPLSAQQWLVNLGLSSLFFLNCGIAFVFFYAKLSVKNDLEWSTTVRAELGIFLNVFTGAILCFAGVGGIILAFTVWLLSERVSLQDTIPIVPAIITCIIGLALLIVFSAQKVKKIELRGIPQKA
jgi:fucose permease